MTRRDHAKTAEQKTGEIWACGGIMEAHTLGPPASMSGVKNEPWKVKASKSEFCNMQLNVIPNWCEDHTYQAMDPMN